MALLVFGQCGQVARELQAKAELEKRPLVALSRAEADLSDPDACAAAIVAHKPSAVINAAAYTAVDQAEQEEAQATVINAHAPAAMARACAKLGIPMVQISTDYVFDGTGDAAWNPKDEPAPIGAYGRTKLAGEQAITDSGALAVILRTSWVFSAHGGNFVKTMLRLGAEREQLGIVADQIGGPTSAASIAAACLAIADQLAADGARAGIYHFAGEPDVSWAGFARAIFAQAGLAYTADEIATKDYPTPAKRPLNSRLDCSSTRTVFGLSRPDWQSDLSAVITQLSR